MKITVRIRTPKGLATSTDKKIRPVIVGFKRVAIEAEVSPEDDTVIWHIDGSVKDCLKIQRNVVRFDFFVRGALDSKMVKKAMKKHMRPDQEAELRDMLDNHTTVECVSVDDLTKSP